MKILCFLLVGIAGIHEFAFGQSRVATTVSIALVNEQAPLVPLTTDAVFSLSASTGQFLGVINLFPIVPNPDIQDSFAVSSRPLQFVMKGQFPAGDISFMNPRDNERKYSMPCTCSVYDSVRSCQLYFSLVSLHDQPLANVAGSFIYTSALDFVLVINPKDYGLHALPFEIPRPIIITAKNGIINKTY
jgi:hypothetical protein